MSEHKNISAVLGVDVGGSHISSALINAADNSVIEGTFCKAKIDAHANCTIVIDQWLQLLRTSLLKANDYELKGIGIAMPGPFDYENGISLISGVNKYQSLYGLNIKQVLSNHLLTLHIKKCASPYRLRTLVLRSLTPWWVVLSNRRSSKFLVRLKSWQLLQVLRKYL